MRIVEQAQHRNPVGGGLCRPALALQAQPEGLQVAARLQLEAARIIKPSALPLIVADLQCGWRWFEIGQRRLRRARRMPERRHHEATVEGPCQRLHPQRAITAAAVGDADEQQPRDTQQYAANHVAQPVCAEVEARETDRDRCNAGQQVGPDPLPARQFACNQHREEAEHHRGHGHGDGRETETGRRRRRPRHVDQRVQANGQHQSERDCGQPVRGCQPASPP